MLYKKVYARHKETIECIFADAKERHTMRYTRLKSLAKVKMKVTLIFACMNLKKMANMLWKGGFLDLFHCYIFPIILKLSIYIEKGRVLKLKNLPFCLQTKRYSLVLYLSF
ncbi:transposase [Clostridium sp.]|uniref:transposase n=1 Tax=Clostridium sp. TaxID=1506 RepID=UPI003994AE66